MFLFKLSFDLLVLRTERKGERIYLSMPSFNIWEGEKKVYLCIFFIFILQQDINS